MQIEQNNPPREFEVGFPENRLKLKDCAHIRLNPNEQVTFVTESGTENDVVRKDWGYYITPSLNGRLLKYNLHAVLVKNRVGQYFILLVESGKECQFKEYLNIEKMQIIRWLDDQTSLNNLDGMIQ